VLVQTTLAESLGFDPDGRSYYAWRDSISGLEYLRAGRGTVRTGNFRGALRLRVQGLPGF